MVYGWFNSDLLEPDMTLSRREMMALTGSVVLWPALSVPAAVAAPLSRSDLESLAGPLTDLSSNMRALLDAFGFADDYWDYAYRTLLHSIADPGDHAIIDCGCPMVSVHEREPLLKLLEAAQQVLAATPETAADRRTQHAVAAFLQGERVGFSTYQTPKIHVGAENDELSRFAERLLRHGTGLIPDTSANAIVSGPPCPGDARCPNGGVIARRAALAAL